MQADESCAKPATIRLGASRLAFKIKVFIYLLRYNVWAITIQITPEIFQACHYL